MEIGVKESFKKKLARSRLGSRSSSVICDKNARWKTGKEQMPRKWKAKAGEQERNCDRRTALIETWKDWEKNGE